MFSPMFMMLFILFSCGKEEKSASALKPLPDSGFRVELIIKQIPSEMKKGKEASAIVTIKNISDQTWPSKGDSNAHYQVNLGYQFFNQASEPIAKELTRTHLPKDLKPGESIELSVVLKAPDEPGTYTLRFDMVQEAVAWFGWKNKGNYSKPSIISVIP